MRFTVGMVYIALIAQQSLASDDKKPFNLNDFASECRSTFEPYANLPLHFRNVGIEGSDDGRSLIASIQMPKSHSYLLRHLFGERNITIEEFMRIETHDAQAKIDAWPTILKESLERSKDADSFRKSQSLVDNIIFWFASEKNVSLPALRARTDLQNLLESFPEIVLGIAKRKVATFFDNELGISQSRLARFDDAGRKKLPISVLKLNDRAENTLKLIKIKYIGQLWTISDEALIQLRGFTTADLNLINLRLERMGLKREAADIAAAEITPRSRIEMVGFEKATRRALQRMGYREVRDILRMSLRECSIFIALDRHAYFEVFNKLQALNFLDQWAGKLAPGSLSDRERDKLPLVWLRLDDPYTETALVGMGYQIFGDLRSLTRNELHSLGAIGRGDTKERVQLLIDRLKEWGIDIE